MTPHWNRSTSLSVLLFFCLPVFAELPPETTEWDLKRDKDGIRIYSSQVSNSDFEAFKAVTVLDAPLQNVMAVMADPESCIEWVHGCVHSEGLGDDDFTDRYAYSVNDLPWPAQDRDYVIRIQTLTERPRPAEQAADTSADSPANSTAGLTIVMMLGAVPDKRDRLNDKVRVEHSDTLYRFHEDAGGRTHMTWLQHTEPNGALPGWLVNSLAIDIPFNSMVRLEKLAGAARYRNHEFIFNTEGELIGVEQPKSERSVPQPNNSQR